MSTPKPATIDAYLAVFPEAAQTAMQEVREAIRDAAPEAEECISYAIPTFKLRGKNLVHFGGFKRHIGFYATPTGHDAFADDLGRYKQGKGSVQFPLDAPMPTGLIKRIVEFRVKEEKEKAAGK